MMRMSATGCVAEHPDARHSGAVTALPLELWQD